MASFWCSTSYDSITIHATGLAGNGEEVYFFCRTEDGNTNLVDDAKVEGNYSSSLSRTAYGLDPETAYVVNLKPSYNDPWVGAETVYTDAAPVLEPTFSCTSTYNLITINAKNLYAEGEDVFFFCRLESNPSGENLVSNPKITGNYSSQLTRVAEDLDPETSYVVNLKPSYDADWVGAEVVITKESPGYQAYIYNGSSWVRATPKIFNGSSWKNATGIIES